MTLYYNQISQDDPQQALILEVIRNDRLRQIEKEKYELCHASLGVSLRIVINQVFISHRLF